MTGLDRLPFDDYADTRPDVLPYDQARTDDACHGCNAEPGEPCR